MGISLGHHRRICIYRTRDQRTRAHTQLHHEFTTI